MSNLIPELKRRRVFKVATAYLIGGWIVVQAADVVREPLAMPNWVFLAILGVVGLGFVLTVALAWTFDVTQDGVRRTPGEADAQIQSLSTGRKIDFVIIGLLVVAVVAFATKDRWFPKGDGVVGVAVLPFLNLSSDEENEHFADGLSEELLNILGNMQGLSVPGRTSMFYYKGRNIDLREIGRNLGVDHILEGSVRRSGNEVRITAQLIRADDGFHVWSRDYDRPLDDIFGIQEDVARSVADALKVTLLGEDEAHLAKIWESDPDAHIQYLVARNRQNVRGQDNLVGAMELYEKITDEHPEFAPAYSGLAESILLLASNHFYFTFDEARDKAQPLIEKALALAPDSATSWRAKGFLESSIFEIGGDDGQYIERSEQAYERALAIDPQDANTLYWYGILMDDSGHRDRAIELYHRSLELDPLARVPRYRLGKLYAQLGDIDRARQELRESIALYPDYGAGVVALGDLELNAGNFAESERLMLEVSEGGGEGNTWFNLFSLYINVGDMDLAAATVDRISGAGSNQRFTDSMKGLLSAVVARDTAAMVEHADTLANDENTAHQFVQLSAISNLIAGNDEVTRQRLEQLLPGILDGNLTVNSKSAYLAMMAAIVLQRQGDDDQAGYLLDEARGAMLANWPDYQPANVDYRLAQIEALMGNDDAAMALLNSAYDKGFRLPWLDVLYPMSDDPMFGNLPADPRFRELHEKIDAENEIARQELTGLPQGG